jgi:molybdate transport system substrate-binding protein
MVRQQVLAAIPALLFAACARPPAEPRTLTVAAAADLSFAMEEISAAFSRAHPGVRIQATFGSSGAFYAQIRNGAPFDVYLSADMNYPRKLAADRIGVPASLFPYGVGRIVVWVPAASRLDPATALRDSSVQRLAIANPEHAPYGDAAVAAMRSLGVYDALAKKLVMGENISQTFGFVESGAADAGIVALSLALAPSAKGKGRYWEIPADAYPPIEQGGILLKDTPDARDFREFLTGIAGRAILKRFGFSQAEPL